MNDERPRLTDEASTIDDVPRQDRALALVQIILQPVPLVGGLLAEIVSNVPRKREARARRLLQRLAAEFEGLGATVDKDYLRSDEYAGLVEDTMERTQRRRDAEKADHFAAALARSAARTRPETAERERMFSVLEEISMSQLELLALVATTRDGAPTNVQMGGVDDTIRHLWPDADMEQVRMDWGDLARMNVLTAYPSGTMTRQGMTNLTAHMSPFGRRFHDFVAPLAREAPDAAA